jgi:hypothetical protein
MFLRICAKPKVLRSGGDAILDYIRRESVPVSRCISANLGRGVRLPSQEVSGVDATEHHILGPRSSHPLG